MNKLTFSLIALSLFLFSSCQSSFDTGQKIINQIRRQTGDFNPQITTPAISPSVVPADSDQSDQQLLDEINQTADPDIDADLSDLEDQLN